MNKTLADRVLEFCKDAEKGNWIIDAAEQLARQVKEFEQMLRDAPEVEWHYWLKYWDGKIDFENERLKAKLVCIEEIKK